MSEQVKSTIESGKAMLGIELGSTRIKSVLIDEFHKPIASGGYDWENQYIDGIWTYPLDEIWKGLQTSYQDMKEDVLTRYGVELKEIASMGFSAMMHGYMVFNKDDELLVPFRTWRNNITEEASKQLTETFNYQIPQRWSIAHLYQAILNKEKHVNDIHFQTTLAGYIHWQLTGEKVLGVGEASGMFPIDLNTKSFNQNMVTTFDQLTKDKDVSWSLNDLLPEVRVAGESGGKITEEGAKLLDPTGALKPGSEVAPPEGDAGTGMVATNSIATTTGNVSAGTSVFAMVVLEKELSKVYLELDLVTTPTGNLVAMAHANNCTSDLNAWVGLFGEFAKEMGQDLDMDTLYGTLYRKALEGDKDAGGLLSYGYLSGEHMTGFEEGRPLFVRTPESHFNLANFMRAHLFSSLGAMKIGMDLLLKEEGVKLTNMLGHGGLFKTKDVGKRMMAASLDTPVSVMETAGEGGAYGIALLAAYLVQQSETETLDDYLTNKVFKNEAIETTEPEREDVEGFEVFMDRYREGLDIERAAIDYLKA